MFPITPLAPATAIGANASVAATALGAFALVQNLSTSAAADFAFNTTNAVPSTMLVSVPASQQLLVRQPPGSGYWASKTTGVTVTPVEVGV